MKTTETNSVSLPDPPRAVRASKQSWIAHFFVLCFLIMIFDFGSVYMGHIRDDVDLEHGPRIMATIVGLHSYLDSHNKEYYQMIVRFPAKGRLVDENVDVDGDEYAQASVGSKTLVTYARRAPSIIRLGVRTPAWAAQDIAAQVVIFLLIAAFFVFGSYILEDEIRLPLTLLRIGLPATATIERTDPGRHGLIVTYAFQAEGKRWKGSEGETANWRLKPEPGVTIAILYLPGKPKRNAPLINVLRMAHLRDSSIFDRS